MAGTTTKNGGWTASLFVTQPAIEKDAPALGAVTTVGARLSRPISRNARVSVDVFNIFDTDFFHPADGRGVRLGVRVTF